MFLLDTDHLGIVQQRSEPAFTRLHARLAGHPPHLFFVSIVSFQEQVAGWNAYLNRARTREGAARAYRMFERILSDFAEAQVLPFDEKAAAAFDELRAQRVRAGTMDPRVAATAITNDMIVLTRNLVDFGRVPGVRAEDWTS